MKKLSFFHTPKKMTESGKVHSNFTVIIIANFQETVKRQSS